jgi:hypothetical protein
MAVRSLKLLLILLAALAVGSGTARADCVSTSELHTCKAPSLTGYQDYTFTYTTPAARESANVCWSCPYVGNQCEGYTYGPKQVVQYDIPAGIVYVSISASDYFAVRPLGAISRDQYRIVGPPSADPIVCTARFEVGGYGSCRSAGTLSMTIESQVVSASYDNGVHMGPCGVPPPITGALDSPVSALPDQPFGITLSAQMTTNPYNGSAYLFGRLVFRGLPPGYAVVSCNGYGGLATPVREGSWGRLKVGYR